MPIVIKEIKVSTTVENKIILPAEDPDSLYERLKEEILEELASQNTRIESESRTKER